MLDWHYALDGEVATVATVAVWKLAGALTTEPALPTSVRSWSWEAGEFAYAPESGGARADRIRRESVLESLALA